MEQVFDVHFDESRTESQNCKEMQSNALIVTSYFEVQDLVWTYELHGIGESRASVNLGSLRCRARERLEERLPVELAGSTWTDQDWQRTELGTGVKLEVVYPKDRYFRPHISSCCTKLDCAAAGYVTANFTLIDQIRSHLLLILSG